MMLTSTTLAAKVVIVNITQSAPQGRDQTIEPSPSYAQLQAGEYDVTCLDHPFDMPRLRFCLRATVNALLAFGLAHALALPMHGLWAVLTAVLVIQTSVGGSLKAAADYIVGTVGGAAFAGAVAAMVPHATVFAFAGVLCLAVAPLAYAAAVSPSFRAAPVTAVLVLMISTQLGETAIELALYRSLGVAVGGVIAITVSLLVFPARAHKLGLEEAARVLEHMAQVLPAVMAGFSTKRNPGDNVRRQDDIGDAVHAFAEIAGEAKPERLVHLAPQPDPTALSRSLLRLRHDLVMIGRAASAPLPDQLAAVLAPRLAQIGATARDYLFASATALTTRRAGPSTEPVERAVAAYMCDISSSRTERLIQGLPVDERERIFASGFALQQLQQNLSDLAACLHEWRRASDLARTSRRERGWKRMALDLAATSSRRMGRAARSRAHGLERAPAIVPFARQRGQIGTWGSHS
jgi:hypothetical protein